MRTSFEAVLPTAGDYSLVIAGSAAANTLPHAIHLHPASLLENEPAGTFVGVLSASDEDDPDETFQFSRWRSLRSPCTPEVLRPPTGKSNARIVGPIAGSR